MQTSYMGTGPGPGPWAARPRAQRPARGPCKGLHFLCICIDLGIFVYIHMYQVYIVHYLSTICQLCVHYLSTICPLFGQYW